MPCLALGQLAALEPCILYTPPKAFGARRHHVASSIGSIFLFPSFQIRFPAQWALGFSFEPSFHRSHLPRNKWCELAVFQLLWHNVGPDFTPFDHVAPMLRMPTRCPCACAFVEAIADLLGREW